VCFCLSVWVTLCFSQCVCLKVSVCVSLSVCVFLSQSPTTMAFSPSDVMSKTM